MSFQVPITIKEVIENIEARNYILPAIQREFVWSESQIEKLFDSLMREYPIGSFLFWKIKEEKKEEYKFYEFIKDYHERDNKHNPKIDMFGRGSVIGILDGQQRFTSLYIGLVGSYAKKKPYYRWTTDKAFPKKKMYLNILNESDDHELKYDFSFLTPEKAKKQNEKGEKHWFKIGDILNIQEEYEINDYLIENNIMNMDNNIRKKFANKTLFRLHALIHKDKIINYFLEEEQDIEKVLDVFIRVNSGGTILSYSDLLLSIATAQWEEKDAREEIYSFVDEINKIGDGFNFSKDFVLKSSLALTDGIDDIRFKVKNFNQENMLRIEKNWENICKVIRVVVNLAYTYGFDDKRLLSNNALIPIAYYLLKKGIPKNYISSNKYKEERKRIKK